MSAKNPAKKPYPALRTYIPHPVAGVRGIFYGPIPALLIPLWVAR